MFCANCGKNMPERTDYCPYCGNMPMAPYAGRSQKQLLVALLLCIFLGTFGAHRFYVGKIGTGLIQLFTMGVFGLWTLLDLILLILDKFTDKQGRKLS